MIMKRTLFAALTALTILAATFSVVPSSSADGLAKSKAAVTFNKDVAGILFKNCADCHRPGEAAPMSLLSYKEARPWARGIREKVLSRRRPTCLPVPGSSAPRGASREPGKGRAVRPAP